MPQGQILLRTKGTIALNGQVGVAGLITTNAPGNKAGWVDAYTRYGFSLEDGAYAKLRRFADSKTPTGNNQAGSHGVAYMGSTIGVRNEKAISLEAHICASTKANLESQLDLFESEILNYGYVQLMTSYNGKVFHLVYQTTSDFTLHSLEMALFTLNFIEPHPEIRTHQEPSILT